MNFSAPPLQVMIQPAFQQCLQAALETPELLENFDRLNEWRTNISMKGSPIERMVDKATGRLDESVREFAAFVYECIYLPLPAQCFEWREA